MHSLSSTGQILVYQEEEYHRLQEAEVVAAQKEATQAVFNRIKVYVWTASRGTGTRYPVPVTRYPLPGTCTYPIPVFNQFFRLNVMAGLY
jgi:hypothetical protein